MQNRKATSLTRAKGVLLFFLWITSVLLVLRIFLQAELDEKNEEHYHIREQTKVVKRENRGIQNKIDDYTSLRYIASRSAGMGFIPATYKVLWKLK